MTVRRECETGEKSDPEKWEREFPEEHSGENDTESVISQATKVD